MKKMWIGLIFLLILIVCENPLTDDEIIGENRTLSGAIQVSGVEDLSGVYIYLDVVNVGVFSDANGEFVLTLPPKSAMNVSGDVSGEYDLYIYSINYELVIKKVILKNSVILYGEADVDKKGKVLGLSLMQSFRVETRSAFPQVSPGDPPKMSITAHFNAAVDSFAVNVPGGNMVLLGGVFIQEVQSGDLYLFELEMDSGKPYIEFLQRTERLWSFHPNVFSRRLSKGRYKIIPLVYPYYSHLPAGLFESLGFSPRRIDAGFMKLFFPGDYGKFEVLEDLGG